MRRLPFIPFLVALTLLAACEDAPPPRVTPAGDSAYALLAALDLGAVAGAYRRLDGCAYTVETGLKVADGDGRRSASRVVARWPTRDGIAERVVAADSTGPLGEGAWSRHFLDPLPRLLPEEPPFLEARAREQYRYALLPDTTLGRRRLHVVEARLRPEASGAQALRRARYLFAPGSDEVLGVEVERTSASTLFDESSHAAVLLQPGPGGSVPARSVVETTVDVPGEARRELRLEQQFRDVRCTA